ncbi:uncharacterized protein J8A68_003680 [[Candida] subhashii]|uniref:Ribosome quality control complex subunit 2 n=1 Tax=[Candida] subhashii TaxID=561895 RepID=A0A8J5UW99_9ASCO|nr:uncharacterized protein J8A68_003680 [[Candida] subhashii]KAG7662825.1 hypothetical protein J8A68_003680 [[Candida] subhashii]
MKQRITSLDLQILTSELSKELLNYRLQNIYNVANSTRQYLFKFSIPDSKKVVVLEYGNRIHLTDFERQTTQQPSNFVTKLRKHLKTRRLSGIKQIPNDRVLVLQFSDGLYYLVLEFFSAGNILLLDEHQKIMSLQRLVTAKEDVDRYAVNEEYKMFDKSLFTDEYKFEKTTYTSEDVKSWIDTHKLLLKEHSDKKKVRVFSIHKLAFVNAKHLPSELIQKCFHDCGINPSQSSLNFEGNEEGIESVVKALEVCEDAYLSLLTVEKETTGYIVGKKNESVDETSELNIIYDEFHPFEPYKENFDAFEFIPVQGYNKTLDKFFSTLESSKSALKIEQQKQHANKRLEKAKSERDRQIQTLVQQQELNSKKGELIQYHSELVEACRAYIQQFLDQSMDWTNIESVIELEKRKGNKLANSIGLPLNLKENKFKILLPDFEEEDSDSSDVDETQSESESESESDSEDEDDFPKKKKSTAKKTKQKRPNVVSTWIDLSLTAFANARLYFDTKKTAETKQTKVEKSTNMAVKNAERKITQDLTKALKQETETLKQMRPKYWFEKFYWFVSNEGYLCLAGRDNAQVDMIYYRHFGDNDFFVSSDLEGSLKVFIKNPFKGELVPPSTVMQAGIFSMSASSGWNGKVTTSAWVMHGTEISKRDFDGSLVPSGEFNYKGKKEYLPPSQLVMGFGLYCLVDEDTTKRYAENRVNREKEHGLTITLDNKKAELEKIKQTQKIEDTKKVEITKEETPQSAQEEVEGSPEADLESISDSVSLSTESRSGKATPIPRGKKSKLKKIAKRYADQDEEERKLRMDALGVLKQVEQREDQKSKEVFERLEAAKRLEEKEAAKERRRKQEAKEYQKYIMDEVDSDESHITNYLEILDSFVSKPSPKDSIINIIPVFAPWQSLQKFKYKVKIQPGSGKKGKSITDALHYFTTRKMDDSGSDTDLDWPVEREIVKTLKPNDLVGVFTVSKVKLVLPSGAAPDSKNKRQPAKKGKKK